MSAWSYLIDRWPELLATFVITMVGVFWGALLAWGAEFLIAARQEARERQNTEHRDRLQFHAYLDRVKYELRDSEQTVTQILDVLGLSTQHARIDLAEFAGTLSKALSVSAYDDLSRSGLQRFLREESRSDLFDARQRILRFKSMLEAAAPAISFHLGYSANQIAADIIFDNLRTYGATALEGVKRAKEAAFSEAEKSGLS